MLRGLNDHIYYVLRDDGPASDILMFVKFRMEEVKSGGEDNLDTYRVTFV